MYYFKVTPPLPFIRCDNGTYKLNVAKSTKMISVCSSNTQASVIVEALIQRELRLMGLHPKKYKASRVNEKYFKLATNKRLCKCNSNDRSETISDTFKSLISKSGKQLSQWILNLTKYE